MKIIYKYKLEISDNQLIKMPKDSKILQIMVLKDSLYVYCLVNYTEVKIRDYHFRIITTGLQFPEDYLEEFDYLGSFSMFEDNFVGHVFVRI